ncbi:MAG: 50S ribosomal protein L18 [Planctomycetales bacterium]|nr:50S ribosomal protein L18 [Planctomycetales bacterium]
MRLEKRIQKQRKNRDWRVGNRVRGTDERPRLSVFRSNKYIYAQIIDDQGGRTLVSASSKQVEVCTKGANGGNAAAAALVGKTLATRALERGIKKVAFDRGSYRYHGRVAALAAAAREGGLDF